MGWNIETDDYDFKISKEGWTAFLEGYEPVEPAHEPSKAALSESAHVEDGALVFDDGEDVLWGHNLETVWADRLLESCEVGSYIATRCDCDPVYLRVTVAPGKVESGEVDHAKVARAWVDEHDGKEAA